MGCCNKGRQQPYTPQMDRIYYLKCPKCGAMKVARGKYVELVTYNCFNCGSTPIRVLSQLPLVGT